MGMSTGLPMGRLRLPVPPVPVIFKISAPGYQPWWHGADGSEDRADIEALVALIDQRRNELQLMAKVLGTRIYAEKPRAFADRSETYWQAWRTEVKDNPILLG